jgi:long-chain fatty acid transport protein
VRSLSRLACAALLSGGAAGAGPLYQTHFGGLTGDAVHEGPFAIYWNPAGLARPGLRLDLHGTFAARQASYDRDAALNQVPDDEAAANAGTATVNTAGAIPALAVGGGLDLGDFTLGGAGAFYILAGGVADWDKNPSAPAQYPGALDGPQRWSTIHSSFVTYAFSAGLGARYAPWGLSLGFAPIYARATLDTIRARNADRSTDLVDAAGNPKEGRILLEADDQRFTWTAGLRWDATPDLTAAVSYLAGTTFHVRGPARITFGRADETREEAVLRMPLASVARAAVAVRIGDWTLRPSVEWADWSVMDRQVAVAADDGEPLLSIERSFRDTWAARARADWALRPDLTLHGGVGFETGATPGKTFEPGLAESWKAEVGVGATFDVGEHLRLSASFVVEQLADQHVSDSIQQPTANGDYADRREFLTLDVEVR